MIVPDYHYSGLIISERNVWGRKRSSKNLLSLFSLSYEYASFKITYNVSFVYLSMMQSIFFLSWLRTLDYPKSMLMTQVGFTPTSVRIINRRYVFVINLHHFYLIEAEKRSENKEKLWHYIGLIVGRYNQWLQDAFSIYNWDTVPINCIWKSWLLTTTI